MENSRARGLIREGGRWCVEERGGSEVCVKCRSWRRGQFREDTGVSGEDKPSEGRGVIGREGGEGEGGRWGGKEEERGRASAGFLVFIFFYDDHLCQEFLHLCLPAASSSSPPSAFSSPLPPPPLRPVLGGSGGGSVVGGVEVVAKKVYYCGLLSGDDDADLFFIINIFLRYLIAMLPMF